MSMKGKMSFTTVMFFSALSVYYFIFEMDDLSSSSSRLRTPPPVDKSMEGASSDTDQHQQVLTTNNESFREKMHMNKESPSPSSDRESSLSPITCDRSHSMYDFCSIKGPAVLDPKQSTFFYTGPFSQELVVEKVRPYPRKWETEIMNGPKYAVREVTLVSGQTGLSCKVQHDAPAMVFSAAGYTGNFFHDFNDGWIPLFITLNSIFPDGGDVVLVVSRPANWWVRRYTELLRVFSNHPIINFDNDTTTHCFPSVHVGLISHGFMTIDPKLMPRSNTFTHFRAVLEKAYRPQTQLKHSGQRPRLVLVCRTGRVSRVLLNKRQVKKAAERVGFEVVLFEPKTTTPLHQAYALINSSNAMVGIHGAALTHFLFLRPGAVFLQVVPIGTEWISDTCFGRPARALELQYLEYKVEPEESSLIKKYGRDELLNATMRQQGQGWFEAMHIYLKEQDVRLDLVRFRTYLRTAYKKAKKLKDTEG